MKKAKGMGDCETGLRNLDDSINRTTRMVEQLLELARLQNDKIAFEDVNLSDCISEVLREYQPRANKKHLIVISDIADNVMIRGHAGSLIIMLRNLIDNAVKYTPENGQASVSLDDMAVLQISDTGSGMAQEEREKAFNRFYRADKTGQTGSGLGLSIVKLIADANNIVISLTDNQPHGLVLSVESKNTFLAI